MLQGVTALNPMSEAMFEQVTVGFFKHLQEGSSLHPVFSVTDDGDININL